LDLKSILKKGEALLKAAHNKSASSDARMLLSYVLNCSKTFLFTHYDYQLTADEEARFVKLAELRAKGVPLQYITGQQEFMSLQFIVNPHVLIPRQETEILVETIIDYIKNIKSRKEKSKNVKSRCIMAKSENTGCKIRNIDCEVRNTDCKARNEKCIERNTDCSERSTGSTGC
jgi:HemK-like putative methylase